LGDGDKRGEALAWPVALAGDKGDRAAWIDPYLLELGISLVIPSKENEDRAAGPSRSIARRIGIAPSSSG
jgi:hypothetical protein